MSLQFKVDSLEVVAEENRGLYQETEGGYQLKVDGIPEQEDVGGLKSALAKERESAKEAARKLKEFETAQAAQQEKTLEENEQYKDLWKTQKEKAEALEKAISTKEVEHATDRLVSTLTKDKTKAALLKKEVSENLNITDGNVIVAGIAGIESVEEYIDHLKETFPFLIDGSKASGGGAAGDGGGGASQDSVSNEVFETWHPGKKMKFIREGGIIK